MPTSPADSWEDAVNRFTFNNNRMPRPGEEFLAMLRAAHHLAHQKDENDLLNAILADAASVLNAQRGAVVLIDDENGLQLRALTENAPGHLQFSRALAQRCIESGESVLCGSVENDVREGEMASVICVLLRTPQRILGVLHLDRAGWQQPFREDDLHLADALAAILAAGIEVARFAKQAAN